ncbi:solute carrier family 33 acetyl- transporter, putative [Ichthyophthirius multifiliis]|uniref:Solute carrier family 33 acetyl-transporter, putative n=1 Tax=Ichthyophthirius multifiliis TaxID=5932 RepID=G0QYQ2_ICHMU|nr:solute carrier family 33 acetyl- transporter, putative [Ichthyophthirius multifiliis]EGR29656.1 solute carrier family 33 acetyl- transporter, putative [Ichthyophthirius multifiliis]|eukprot:XP_004030892.1 solute carrier family 33 acetyl- transporter, putative [Ichthyophthirius multifiliis]
MFQKDNYQPNKFKKDIYFSINRYFFSINQKLERFRPPKINIKNLPQNYQTKSYPLQNPKNLDSEDTQIIKHEKPLKYITPRYEYPADIYIPQQLKLGEIEQPANPKTLELALVGAPNSGKSSLLNRLVNSRISAVSPKANTTSEEILGVYTQLEDYAQFEEKFLISCNTGFEEEIVKFHESPQNPSNVNEKIPLTPKEKHGIILLLILYFIQGLPIGFFGAAIPLILAEKKVEMQKLAELQTVFYPFAFKFLIAPILDAYYIPSFGKRKSYIIPLQYILSICFIIMSYQIDELIQTQNILWLTFYGFLCCFVAASQDIAVDGWVLTIFENEEHVSIGSTCNNVGQIFGVFVSNSQD